MRPFGEVEGGGHYAKIAPADSDPSKSRKGSVPRKGHELVKNARRP